MCTGYKGENVFDLRYTCTQVLVPVPVPSQYMYLENTLYKYLYKYRVRDNLYWILYKTQQQLIYYITKEKIASKIAP